MIGVGVIGLGHNGVGHIEAHRAVGMSEIVALCDRNPERLAKLAAGYVLRFNPVFEAVHDLCRSGKLGDVYSLKTLSRDFRRSVV